MVNLADMGPMIEPDYSPIARNFDYRGVVSDWKQEVKMVGPEGLEVIYKLLNH